MAIQTSLKRYIRRWKARKQANAHNPEHNVQSAMRTLVAVKRLNNLRRASTKVQRVFRGYRCRKQLAQEKQRAMDSELAEVREYASLLLQKAVRGMLARRHAAQLRAATQAQAAQRSKSAARIQRSWRKSRHRAQAAVAAEKQVQEQGGHDGGRDEVDSEPTSEGLVRPPIEESPGWMVKLVFDNDGEDEFVHGVVVDVDVNAGAVTVRCIDIHSSDSEEHDEEIPYDAEFIQWIEAPTEGASASSDGDDGVTEEYETEAVDNDSSVIDDVKPGSKVPLQQDEDATLFEDPESSEDDDQSLASLEMAAMENIVSSARRTDDSKQATEHAGFEPGTEVAAQEYATLEAGEHEHETPRSDHDTSSDIVQIASLANTGDVGNDMQIDSVGDDKVGHADTDKADSDVFDLSDSETSFA